MSSSNRSVPPGSFARTLLPPLAIAAVGVVFFTLAQTQPAWIGPGPGTRIGPGLFAQWLSLGVVGLSMLWAAIALAGLRRPRHTEATDATTEASGEVRLRGGIGPGLALLAAVCLFALLLPVAGLIVACASAAAVAGWGAGDRDLRALGLSALLGAAVAAGIGLTLLPPTTRLWPWGVF
ncbi:tripartite tricarboxylate transporter TctB family protein [Algihabitans albus]|uniref:tripartite tricarboxylate transporter TctB family protein n=1 Tax=Algihabitans albus TaxID=2164067 RepID=UPI0013C2FE9B|nr:tripartite tricarboxylate transporter TctB family protein [Algihabitans albus]